MSGTFTSKTGPLDGFSQKPTRHTSLPTAQRALTNGSGGETFLILLETGVNQVGPYIQLEDGSGRIELEDGP